jgi:eukaryotic translation initiation factor 2C
MHQYISDLKGMMKERVMAWYARTKLDPKLKTESWKQRLPEHVLFYRDGVSESQYGMVFDEEKDQIIDGCQEAFKEVKKDSKNNRCTPRDTWRPNLTLLVVTKRHHARFFPWTELDSSLNYDKKADINLKSGLVVDTVVVNPIKRDFYLQSHHSELGTARSGHYVVIFDQNDYDIPELQQIVKPKEASGVIT